MDKFRVGDRVSFVVRYSKDPNVAPQIDDEGEIISITSHSGGNKVYGIKLDRKLSGAHTAGGRTPPNFGWFATEEYIVLANEAAFEQDETLASFLDGFFYGGQRLNTMDENYVSDRL